VTAGGRVVGVTALAGSLDRARENALAAAAKVRFKGAFFRRDIGARSTPALSPARKDIRESH